MHAPGRFQRCVLVPVGDALVRLTKAEIKGAIMALTPTSELRDVYGIDDFQKQQILAFMQGAVYCWVKNHKDEPFVVRDLMGGENFDWDGTPLYALYQKHIDAGKDNNSAIESAAKDLGWLVKTMLSDDKRTYEASKAGLVSSYRWVGNEP